MFLWICFLRRAIVPGLRNWLWEIDTWISNFCLSIQDRWGHIATKSIPFFSGISTKFFPCLAEFLTAFSILWTLRIFSNLFLSMNSAFCSSLLRQSSLLFCSCLMISTKLETGTCTFGNNTPLIQSPPCMNSHFVRGSCPPLGRSSKHTCSSWSFDAFL